jgi:thioredoxin reductase (NADPH)
VTIITRKVIIVGGGPAGLTAALYLARFHLSVFLADAQKSRAELITLSHNQPGCAEGISGSDLLQRMRDQVRQYGVELARTEVREIRNEGGRFVIQHGEAAIVADVVLLATGTRDRRLNIPNDTHTAALENGTLRYCPICDGYEVTDKAVVVIGHGQRLLGEARFLRSFSSRVTVASESGNLELSPDQYRQLTELGVEAINVPIARYVTGSDSIDIGFADRVRRFDTIYVAMGSDAQSSLGAAAGAKTTPEGCLVVDRHQRTTVQGLYAAGDVTEGLDQIAVAIGQASIAATAIRNDLCDATPLLRRE